MEVTYLLRQQPDTYDACFQGLAKLYDTAKPEVMDSEQHLIMTLPAVTSPNIREAVLSENSSLLNKTTTHEYIETHQVLITTVWGIITVIGAVGNTIVVFTMCRHKGRSLPRSATNCYIINVALADLAFILIVVPITTAAYVSHNWIYGEVVCKLNSYVIYVTLMSTCLTLTAMTIDRYFAIVHPIRSLHRRTPKSTIIICIAIWLASLAACSPFLVVYQVQQRMTFIMTTVCVANWPLGWDKISVIIVVLVTYVIPLSVIIISYTLILKFLWRHRIDIRREENSDPSEPVMGGGMTIARRRKKVAKIVAAVVILFAITWLPIHLFHLCFYLMSNFPMTQTMYNLKIIAHTLSYTNSCLNPFVYTIMGDNFRKAFRESLCGSGSPSAYKRPGYSRRTASTTETRFNGD